MAATLRCHSPSAAQSNRKTRGQSIRADGKDLPGNGRSKTDPTRDCGAPPALTKHQAPRVILVVLRIGPSDRNRANA